MHVYVSLLGLRLYNTSWRTVIMNICNAVERTRFSTRKRRAASYAVRFSWTLADSPAHASTNLSDEGAM